MKNEAENILRYQDLTAEIQRIWNVMISDTRATGTISK